MNAVIFDMDGVIVDSEPVHQDVERALFRDLSLPVTPEEHDGYLGTSSPDMFGEIARRHPAEWRAQGLSVAAAVELERRRYDEAIAAGAVPVIPGVVDVMRALAQRGFLIAIASSAPRGQIEAVIALTGTADVVRCIRSADDVTRSKPDPEIYRTAAACLGVAPEDCWVIEDSANGIAAAKDAGMRCIAFRNPSSGRPDLSRADAIVDTMSSVTGIVGAGAVPSTDPIPS
jgi:beta-phosphoglucomutase